MVRSRSLTVFIFVLALLSLGVFLLLTERGGEDVVQTTDNNGTSDFDGVSPEKIQDFPEFSAYTVPLSEVFRGEPAAPRFDDFPEAKTFVTKITEGAKEGPNFAGHYTVITWGCGTSCQTSAILDAISGDMVVYGITSSYDLEYRLNSRLLITNPPKNLPNPEHGFPYETIFYELEKGKLQMIERRTLEKDVYGVIRGRVSIGPICPVEMEGVPCEIDPEVYTSREILVYKEEDGAVAARAHLSSDGSYQFVLPPGVYLLDIPRGGIEKSAELPYSFKLEAGAVERFNFSIDTGIR